MPPRLVRESDQAPPPPISLLRIAEARFTASCLPRTREEHVALIRMVRMQAREAFAPSLIDTSEA